MNNSEPGMTRPTFTLTRLECGIIRQMVGGEGVYFDIQPTIKIVIDSSRAWVTNSKEPMKTTCFAGDHAGEARDWTAGRGSDDVPGQRLRQPGHWPHIHLQSCLYQAYIGPSPTITQTDGF